MRPFISLAALSLALAPVSASARLFWHTYGATVATADGCGCAWNINQDYFVPRHCDTGRYDLFSACKTSHTRSPACKFLHPVYCGYCTPYGPCRYRWRDHVYKVHCGCTPLRHEYGPWHFKKCGKHSLVLRNGGCPCGGVGACGPALAHGLEPLDGAVMEFAADGAPLCNVEAFGGVLLGDIAALPAGMAGGGSASAVSNAAAAFSAPASTSSTSAPSVLPKIGISPPPSASGGYVPPPLGF
jgi:hypothetical protein